MKSKEKTKEQLQNELVKLRQQITELQKLETKHHQIEETLGENEEKYRTLVELADVGIQIETVEGRILECNTAGAKIYGYTKEEMMNLTLADLVPEEFAKTLPQVISEKETTHGIFLPRISKKKDGTIFPTEVASKIVNIRGKPRLIAYVRDITERKKAEKKLRKARKMFTNLFNSNPEAVLYHDKEGRILNINPRFTELFGYTPEEMIGKKIDEGIIYPANRIKEGKILTQKAFNGFSDYETIRRKKDGTLVPVIISTAPVIIDKKPQGTIALYKNITERKKAEETLQKSQQEFAGVFRSNPEALIYVDEKGDILNINSRFTELFGYTLGEIKGKNIDSGVIHPPNKLGEGERLTKKSLEGYLNFETIRKKKDGTLFPVAISISNIVINGKLKGGIGTYIDITERKKMEQELERLAHYDVLTGCYSRGHGLALLEQQIKIANRKKMPVTLFYLDIDRFKYINDTFGHQEGDKVLKEAVKFFKLTLRKVDIICRLGGDEFLLILSDTSPEKAPQIRKRINKNLKKLNQKLAKSYKINFSIGLSHYNPFNPLSIEELIKIADENMYEEKKKKKEGK
ncbi:MAG: PAS domain S-box protein [Candidatus Caldatribacteriota bacterium]|nr:PAS domain S-box protein [Candidatus Caldatribacteriota bacterium]